MASIKVEGLKELRAALKAAEDATPRELTKALKASGKPVPAAIEAKTPVRTGALKESIGKPTAAGKRAGVTITAKHAPFVEFRVKGRFGETMTAKYGPPPRFGYKGLDSVADEVIEILDKELRSLLKVHGWFD